MKTLKPDEKLRALQLKQLEILDALHKICCDNNIEYSLCGGSAIGAYLYKGFIPWDDDIDIMMTRENYLKFLKVCDTDLPKQYELIHFSKSIENLQILFAKIIDKNTTLVENSYTSSQGHITGVFIDITVYDYVPNKCIARVFQQIATICHRLLLCGRYNKKYSKLFYLFFNNKSKKYIITCAEKIISIFKSKDKYLLQEFWADGKRDCYYPAAIFKDYIEIEYEGKLYKVIKNYIDYLQICYKRTDFRLPEEQQVPHHIIHFDLNKPYKEYIEEQTKY